MRRTRCARLWALLALCAASAPQLSWSESGITQLRQMAHTWEDRGRTDKAIELWRKVLRLDAKQVDALAAVGCWSAHRGQLSEARQLLDRLTAVAPKSAQAERLRYAIRVGKRFDRLIATARAQVRAGNVKQAVASYQQAFGNTPPSRFALEYYQTLGGAPGGWRAARAGLERNARRKPRSLEARLAYAKHLTYREGTRRVGIGQLAALVDRPGAASRVQPAWRQALLWLNAKPADARLFQRYLGRVETDTVVRRRLAQLSGVRRRDNLQGSLQAGYEALARDDVKEAGRIFEGARQGPESLVGLAMVAMKREDFALAQELLEKVKANAPDRPQLWEQSLKSATFWASMRRADRATEAGELQLAEQELRKAVGVSAAEAHHAQLALAKLEVRQQRHAAAEALLRGILREHPKHADALRALVTVYLQTAAYDKALETNRQLAALAPKQAIPTTDLNAEILRRRAARLRQEGGQDKALGLLLAAVELAPKNYWAIHDLANLHLELGETEQARPLVATLIELEPGTTAGRLLQARMAAEAKHYAEALEILRALPPKSIDPASSALVKQIRMRVEVDKAVRLARSGSGVAQRHRLLRLEHQAERNPSLIGIVALGWSEIGDQQHAIDLIYEALSLNRRPPTGLRLQLAAVLMKANRHAELLEVLHGLRADRSLNPRERRDLARMRVAYSVRQADQLSNAGEYQRALLQLEPLLREHPKDRSLLNALGRLFYQSADYKEAALTFERVLERHPRDLEAREGAILAAKARRRMGQGQRLVKEGLSLMPDNARMYLIAGRFAASAGDDAQAMRHFNEARARAGAERPWPVKSADSGARGGAPLSRSSDTRSLIRYASHRYADRAEQLTPTEGLALMEGIDAEIHRIRSRHNVRLPGKVELRHRVGRKGLDRLGEVKVPLAASIPLRYSGRIAIHVTPVLLTAGPVPAGGLLGAFGSSGTAPDADSDLGQQQDAGAALRLAYRHRDKVEIDLGSTPLGFTKQNVVGGLKWRDQWGSFSLALDAGRRSVTDSVLSYAGTTDQPTRRSWGGVMRQGGRLDLGFDTGSGSIYLIGGGYFYNGSEVANNSSFVGSLGGEWKVHDWGGQTVVLGTNVFAMGYADNLSQFTIGHGGYFSPEIFVRAGVPLRWRGTTSRLRWNLCLDPGLSWFRAAAAPIFPNDPELQQTQQSLADQADDPSLATYPENTELGFSFSAEGQVQYELTRLVDLGAFGSARVAPEYREYTVGAFMQVNFRGRAKAGKGQ